MPVKRPMSADGGFYTVVAQVVRTERLSTCEEVRWTKTSTRRLRCDGSQECNCSSRETSERSERSQGNNYRRFAKRWELRGYCTISVLRISRNFAASAAIVNGFCNSAASVSKIP